MNASTFVPKAGAQCASSARWDLCGGPPARAVPTAIRPRGTRPAQRIRRRSVGHGAPSGLERVREVARRDKEARFTALLHHVSVDRLRAAYRAIRPQAASGVDGVTWEAYGQDLEANLQDLHRRLHAGSYRARPSRRSYIVRREALCCIPNSVGRNLEDCFWVQWLT
jgi:RNA-directed DNA polymerase